MNSQHSNPSNYNSFVSAHPVPKTRSVYRVRFFTVALTYMLVFVAGIMALVMSTAKDRDAYMAMFAEPFGNSRIEIGFKYYMEGLAVLGVPPDVGIVLTCVLIYTILAATWHSWVRVQWLESLLIFNFFAFSLFSHFLGTSIRMGLACVLALYATIGIFRGRKNYLILVWASGIVHYGMIPFALTVTWLVVARRFSWRLHKLCILTACILFPLLLTLILQKLSLGSYYMAYFDDQLGQLDRVISFKAAFFIVALLLISWKGNDTFLRRVAFYGLPFLFYGVVTGLAVFTKMLTPNIFISAMVVTSSYWGTYTKNVDSNVRLFVAIVLNSLAIVYALRAYQYI